MPRALLRLNRLPGVAIFTLEDRIPVVPGKIVTGVKVTPVAVAEATLREAEAIAARGAGGSGRAVPAAASGGDQHRGSGLAGAGQVPGVGRAEDRLVRWLGASGSATCHGMPTPSPPRSSASSARGPIWCWPPVGTRSILSIPRCDALDVAGADIVRFGAPAHPGSMFWLAYRGKLPIFNLASCSMFSKSTIADVVLPWIMTGERVEADTLAGLGFGGLLDRGMTFRFPPYDVDGVEESGEE